MTIKGKDFKKAVAFIKDFLQKMPEDADCAQLRDSLNLSLLYMKKYFRTVWLRSQEQNDADTLSSSMPRGLSPTVPHYDKPDRFSWRWAMVDHSKILRGSLPVDGGKNVARLPLILQAAKEGDKQLIEQLIQKEPSCVNAEDEFGRTPIMYAVHFGEQECLEVLIDAKANTSHQAHDGSTVLHVAIHDGNYDAVEFLLKHQADAGMQDSQGRTPAHWATMMPDTQCLELLLQCNIDINIRDRDGLTPAMWACHMDNQRHFELLTSTPNNKIAENDGIERDAVGRTWIHWAVRRNEPLKCLQNLLTTETAAIKDNEGRTVIHISAQQGALEACKAIVSQVGVQCLNDVDNHNRTCLHMAAMAAHGEVLNYLLEQGADVSIADSSNLTAWDYSCNRNLHYCMMIIRSYHKQLEYKQQKHHHHSNKHNGQEELEDIEENNNCAISNSEKYISKTPAPPPPNDKSNKPSPPNQPRPLFQTFPVPNKARSPRPLSPKVPLKTPVKKMEESKTQDVTEPEVGGGSSPKRHKGSDEAENKDRNLQQMDSLDGRRPHLDNESGEIVHSSEDGIISSDMQPSYETQGYTQGDESEIPDGGFENRQRSVSLASDDVSEQSINIGMDVSDIDGEGHSNPDSTAEERPVEPLSPKSRTPTNPSGKTPSLLPGRLPASQHPPRPASPGRLPASHPPRPSSPGPAMIFQPGQQQSNNAIQNTGRENQLPSQERGEGSLPPPMLSPKRLIPLGGGGNLVNINNTEGKGNKGKKKKKKRTSSGGSDSVLQPIGGPIKSPTAPLQPVFGGHFRPPSPINRPGSPSNQSSSSSIQPLSPGNRPSSPANRPPSPGNRPSSPGNRPPSPGNRPSSPGNRPASPGNRPPSPGNRPASPVNRPPSPGNSLQPPPLSGRPISPSSSNLSPPATTGRVLSSNGNLRPPALSGRSKSPNNNLQPSLPIGRSVSPNNQNLQAPPPLGRPVSPRSDSSTSPRPPSSRGSSPQPSPASRNKLPQAQGNSFEVSWKPKQPKIPSTPVTPRDQRTGSPLTLPQQGPAQRSPKGGNQIKPIGKKEGSPAGVHKPQPLHPQARPLAPMKPGGNNLQNQQRPLAPRLSQHPPKQNASQSYTQPLNPAPPRNKSRTGGYSL